MNLYKTTREYTLPTRKELIEDLEDELSELYVTRADMSISGATSQDLYEIDYEIGQVLCFLDGINHDLN